VRSDFLHPSFSFLPDCFNCDIRRPGVERNPDFRVRGSNSVDDTRADHFLNIHSTRLRQIKGDQKQIYFQTRQVMGEVH